MIDLRAFHDGFTGSDALTSALPVGVSVTRFAALAVAVEAELRGLACDFFLSSRMEQPEGVLAAIGDAVELDAAWRELLAELGIPRAVMADAGPPRHYAVKTVLQLVKSEEDPAKVETFLAAMREFLTA